MVNVSITVLTCPFKLYNVNSTGAVSKVLSHLSHWLDFSMFSHLSPILMQYLHLNMFVCFHRWIEHLRSNFYSHFLQLLTLPAMKYNPVFDILFLAFCIWFSSPFMRDIFDWCPEFCSKSSSSLAPFNILLYFFKEPSILQVDSQPHSTTLWPSCKQQRYKSWIVTVSHLLLLFYYVTFLDPVPFSKNFAAFQNSDPPTRSLAWFLEPVFQKLCHEPLLDILTPFCHYPLRQFSLNGYLLFSEIYLWYCVSIISVFFFCSLRYGEPSLSSP